MDREAELRQEVEALRDRLSKLSEASLRISESLDYNKVLQGVLDSACAVTGARYGVITLLNETGVVEESLSSGYSPEDERRLMAVPGGDTLSEYLTQLPGPLRLADFHDHLRSMGLPEFRWPGEGDTTFPLLAMPIRSEGERAGYFCVAEKLGGGEFSIEDETTFLMFASQAAMVIANARRYRDEQRARADLEALVDTSPVGVVVFDARTGKTVSFNREAMRIVSGLHDRDTAPESLMEVLTARRADGQEFSLQDFSMTQLLSASEAFRAEEIVLQVPDGRSVTTLVNATPIHSQKGELETFVFTLQDLTPIQEVERLRAEFLATVSHELRTPLATLKGSVTTLLEPPATLNPTESRQFFRIIDAQLDRMHVLVSDLLDVARIDTGTLAVSPEPTDVAVVVEEVRTSFISSGSRHTIEVDIPSDLAWVMADRLRIVQVLGNLLNNAARHSPESSPLRVTAAADGVDVVISVSDEGRGIPAESLPLLFTKFSRIDAEEQGGDTGLGLAICKGIVEAHGGRIWAESGGAGLGARFSFTIPTVEDRRAGCTAACWS